MNRDVQRLREVITKLVPMLTGRGLRVTQSGYRAYVKTNARTNKPEVVNIPSIPDNATTGFISAVQGFVDHEVGHVLHTNWKHYGGSGSIKDKFTKEGQVLMNIHNILEDTFVEREMIKMFPGSKNNLENLFQHFIEKITKPALVETGNNKTSQFSILMVPMIRALSGQKEFQEFMDEGKHWDQDQVKDLMLSMSKRCRELIKSAKSTQETFEAAQEIHDILYTRNEKEQNEQNQKQSSDSQSQDKPDKKAGEGEGDGERDHSNSQASDDASDDEDEGDGAASSESDKQDEAQAGDGRDVGENKDEQGEKSDEGEDHSTDSAASDEDKSDNDVSDGSDHGEGDTEDSNKSEDADGEAENCDQADNSDSDGQNEEEWSGDDGDVSRESDDSDDSGPSNVGGSTSEGNTGSSDQDLSNQGQGGGAGGNPSKGLFDLELSKFDPIDLSQAIANDIAKQAAGFMQNSEYNVYTRDYDKISPMPVDEKRMRQEWVGELEDTIGRMIGPMQKSIERMMAAQSRVHKTPGFRSGKIHTSSLYRLKLNDDRVFSRKEEFKSKDTAVSLLVDNSGSMRGGRIIIALQAAYALAKTLERVGISCEVLGFTTGPMPSGVINEARTDIANKNIKFHRCSTTIVMPIFKDFNERITPEVKRRFAFQINNQVGMNTNTDGESLEYAAARLIPRREKRKVLLVMSDGQPVGHGSDAHLAKTTRALNKMGIETVGIGIQSDAVEDYYERSLVLGDIEKLPEVVMNELKRILSN